MNISSDEYIINNTKKTTNEKGKEITVTQTVKSFQKNNISSIELAKIQIPETYITDEITYKTNEFGQRVKVTRKIKITKTVKIMSKYVYDRKVNWNKFGKSANTNNNSNVGTTTNGEEKFTFNDWQKKERYLDEQINKIYESLNKAVQDSNRNVGGLYRPPIKKFTQDEIKRIAQKEESSGNNKYVPPMMRNMQSSSKDPNSINTKIRVDNLAEDITEDNLRTIFRTYGDVTRVIVVKNKFGVKAFITFTTHNGAKTALEGMNRQPLDNLILDIEWAVDRER